MQHDICHGLKFKNTVSKMMFSDVEDYTLGSFGPKKDIQTWFARQWEVAPTGFMTRGKYGGKGFFYDLDGNKHLEWQYNFQIVK